MLRERQLDVLEWGKVHMYVWIYSIYGYGYVKLLVLFFGYYVVALKGTCEMEGLM